MVEVGPGRVAAHDLFSEHRVVVPRRRDDHVAARGERVRVLPRDLRGLRGVHQVQDRGQDQADRLAHVDGVAQFGGGEQRLGVIEVAVHRGHVVAAVGEQGFGVVDDERIVVHVDHTRPGVDRVRRLVRARAGRQAGPEVGELLDALSRHPADRADDERPVLLDQLAQSGKDRQQLLGLSAVGLKVVFSPEPVVVDASDVRLAGVERWGHARNVPNYASCRCGRRRATKP
jgi:hypothetical protein